MNSNVHSFIEYLAKGDIILAYWNPEKGELMPILYVIDDLVKNYERKKPPVSGKVKASR